jgi:alkanesulfonate monooxygenase SsuD/methylene tetrahydromethanopterin reductase-like flavin-dependent oxidoreductase (luciferase family)
MSSEGAMIVGDPDEALRQVRLWESAGADQLVLSVSLGQPKERTLKTIELMGEYVIPKVDTDPVHRTTRFRQAAG